VSASPRFLSSILTSPPTERKSRFCCTSSYSLCQGRRSSPSPRHREGKWRHHQPKIASSHSWISYRCGSLCMDSRVRARQAQMVRKVTVTGCKFFARTSSSHSVSSSCIHVSLVSNRISAQIQVEASGPVRPPPFKSISSFTFLQRIIIRRHRQPLCFTCPLLHLCSSGHHPS